MPYLSTSCKRATPETAIKPFQGWPACRAGCPAAIFFPFGHPMLHACTNNRDTKTSRRNSEFVAIEATTYATRVEPHSPKVNRPTWTTRDSSLRPPPTRIPWSSPVFARRSLPLFGFAQSRHSDTQLVDFGINSN
jgi:hypothetical protein